MQSDMRVSSSSTKEEDAKNAEKSRCGAPGENSLVREQHARCRGTKGSSMGQGIIEDKKLKAGERDRGYDVPGNFLRRIEARRGTSPVTEVPPAK